MVQRIKKAAVLGSGVMGSGIAAHLANCGIPTILLDRLPTEITEQERAQGLTLQDKQVRNRYSALALKKLLQHKPAPLTSKKNLSFITPGNLEDHLESLREVDWIIEVVVENLEVKKQLLAKVEHFRKPGAIVSSNTSGISIEKMSEGRSAEFQAHFLGTHFFNPPRYLKLIELIPTKTTNPAVLNQMKQFAEEQLGKGVVIAKDTPNFIANRIGTYGMQITIQEMLRSGFSVGEVDSLTGTLIGRPKSATFRTLDVVGLDTYVHVVNNIHELLGGPEKDIFTVPEFLKKMLQSGWFGSKSGQGFFLKKGKEILELNPNTLQYEPLKKVKAKSIERSKQEKGRKDRLKALVYAEDRAGMFLWKIISAVLLYSAEKLGEIADDIVAIDQAMKWGFGWEQGLFEIWDAIGVSKSVAKMEQEGTAIPHVVKEMLENGFTSFYQEEGGRKFYYHNREFRQLNENSKVINISRLKKQEGNVIKQNSGASLIDVGDGVAMLEFHSPNNAIGQDIISMINHAIDEVEQNFKGLVIGNQGKNFCVGANLAMILMEAQDDNFFELEMVVRSFQKAMMKIKYSTKPVVAAPFAMTLGGGAEVCLPAARIQAATETYMGLVEVGVGLIPGGGGNKELYLKLLHSYPEGAEADLQKVANAVFEKIAMAKVSTSAEGARENFYLSSADGISRNGDYLLYDAKQTVLELDRKGYQPPVRKAVPVVGATGYATLLLGAQNMYYSGFISDHDLKIAKKLAHVIAGGKVPYGTEVDEQYLLDLEREAFLSLVGEPKTQARMQHMLLKGKPLRN